jgi:hypothetical protein
MTDQSHAQPQTSTSTATGVLALLKAKPGVTRERVMAIMPAEIRAHRRGELHNGIVAAR